METKLKVAEITRLMHLNWLSKKLRAKGEINLEFVRVAIVTGIEISYLLPRHNASVHAEHGRMK